MTQTLEPLVQYLSQHIFRHAVYMPCDGDYDVKHTSALSRLAELVLGPIDSSVHPFDEFSLQLELKQEDFTGRMSATYYSPVSGKNEYSVFDLDPHLFFQAKIVLGDGTVYFEPYIIGNPYRISYYHPILPADYPDRDGRIKLLQSLVDTFEDRVCELEHLSLSMTGDSPYDDFALHFACPALPGYINTIKPTEAFEGLWNVLIELETVTFIANPLHPSEVYQRMYQIQSCPECETLAWFRLDTFTAHPETLTANEDSCQCVLCGHRMRYDPFTWGADYSNLAIPYYPREAG